MSILFMPPFIRKLFGKNLEITKINSIDNVKIVHVYKIIHDRNNWTIIYADVIATINGIEMEFTIDVSMKSRRATIDKWYRRTYYPLDYDGLWISNDICSTNSSDFNRYTIPADSIGPIIAYIVPFIKELKTKIIYR